MKGNRYFMRHLNYWILSYYQIMSAHRARKGMATLFDQDKELVKSMLSKLNLPMLKLLRLGLITIFVGLFLQGVAHASFSPLETQMIRIHLIVDGVSHEWEFDHPDLYEYEVGEKVVKGERGKQLVEEMLSLVQLKELSRVDDIVTVIKERYPQLEHLDIRMRNAEGKLFTWVWNKHHTPF